MQINVVKFGLVVNYGAYPAHILQIRNIEGFLKKNRDRFLACYCQETLTRICTWKWRILDCSLWGPVAKKNDGQHMVSSSQNYRTMAYLKHHTCLEKLSFFYKEKKPFLQGLFCTQSNRALFGGVKPLDTMCTDLYWSKMPLCFFTSCI